MRRQRDALKSELEITAKRVSAKKRDHDKILMAMRQDFDAIAQSEGDSMHATCALQVNVEEMEREVEELRKKLSEKVQNVRDNDVFTALPKRKPIGAKGSFCQELENDPVPLAAGVYSDDDDDPMKKFKDDDVEEEEEETHADGKGDGDDGNDGGVDGAATVVPGIIGEVQQDGEKCEVQEEGPVVRPVRVAGNREEHDKIEALQQHGSDARGEQNVEREGSLIDGAGRNRDEGKYHMEEKQEKRENNESMVKEADGEKKEKEEENELKSSEKENAGHDENRKETREEPEAKEEETEKSPKAKDKGYMMENEEETRKYTERNGTVEDDESKGKESDVKVEKEEVNKSITKENEKVNGEGTNTEGTDPERTERKGGEPVQEGGRRQEKSENDKQQDKSSEDKAKEEKLVEEQEACKPTDNMRGDDINKSTDQNLEGRPEEEPGQEGAKQQEEREKQQEKEGGANEENSAEKVGPSEGDAGGGKGGKESAAGSGEDQKTQKNEIVDSVLNVLTAAKASEKIDDEAGDNNGPAAAVSMAVRAGAPAAVKQAEAPRSQTGRIQPEWAPTELPTGTRPVSKIPVRAGFGRTGSPGPKSPSRPPSTPGACQEEQARPDSKGATRPDSKGATRPDSKGATRPGSKSGRRPGSKTGSRPGSKGGQPKEEGDKTNDGRPGSGGGLKHGWSFKFKSAKVPYKVDSSLATLQPDSSSAPAPAAPKTRRRFSQGPKSTCVDNHGLV
eukprot:GHVU01127662.1.p1 GENE.GHVU01127662.1~~GHVU01127662.1.p1  ORF type:complete len:734 (+),score=193.29 GHVU01127662.1:1718-3919(+)